MTVPDVVGLPFHIGTDVAAEAGVTLANPDPDGPPIGLLTWPGLDYIVRQETAPGALLYEWDLVGVEVVKHGDVLDREPATPRQSPPVDAAHAKPEPEQYVDVTDD